MEPLPVVKDFEIIEDDGPCLRVRGLVMAVDALSSHQRPDQQETQVLLAKAFLTWLKRRMHFGFRKVVAICSGLYLLLVAHLNAANPPEVRNLLLLGGTANSWISHVVLDSAQNQYILGSFVNSGTCIIGTNTFTSGTARSGLVAKIGPTGAVLWARQITGPIVCNDLGLDGEGNLLIVGQAVGSPNFFGHGFNPVNPTSMFVLKLSNAGEYVWARVLDATSYTSGNLLELNEDGSGTVIGRFRGTFSISAQSGTVTLQDSFNLTGFLLTFTSAGTITSALALGSGEFDPKGLRRHPSGDLYVTGDFTGTWSMGGTNLTSAGASDAFLLRLASGGTLEQAWQVKGTNNVSPGFVQLDEDQIIWGVSAQGSITFGSQKVYTGNNQSFHLLRFAEDQTTASVYTSGGTNMSAARCVLIGDDLLISGTFSGTGIFGATNIVSNGARDGYLGMLSREGTWRWVVASGGTASEVFYQPYENRATREIHLSGQATSGSFFDTAVSTTSGFLVKLGFPSPPPLGFSMGAGSLTLSWPGDSDSFHLESAAHLLGPWQRYTGNFQLEEGTNTVSVPITDSLGFFRLTLP